MHWSETRLYDDDFDVQSLLYRAPEVGHVRTEVILGIGCVLIDVPASIPLTACCA